MDRSVPSWPSRLDALLLEFSFSSGHGCTPVTDDAIRECLGKLGRLVGAQQSALRELSADGQGVYRQLSHVARGYEGPPLAFSTGQFPWLARQYGAGNTVAWPSLPDALPSGADVEREEVLRTGIRAFLGIPSRANEMLYVMTFASLRARRTWPEALVQKLRLACRIVSGVLVRRHVAVSLQANESRNQAMLRALPDQVFVLSPDGVYREHYGRGDSELLVPPSQFLGRAVEDVLLPPAALRFRSAARQATRSGEVVEVEYSTSIRGELREREARIAALDDGAIVSIVRNVTDRNRAARELRESEGRFRGAFEHSAIGFALVAPTGRWLQVNPALCRMLGYSREALLATDFQKLTHPDDLPRNLDLLQQALTGQVDHYELEKRFVHQDGHAIPALLNVSVVRDAGGNALHLVSQIQDLTGREYAQMEIERLRVELAHAGRLALTGQLTASLAHELMQPIAAVRSNAEAGQRLVAADEPALADVPAILEDILSSCNRAEEVVNNVRNLLRKEPRPRRRVDLNRLVEGVVRVTYQELMLRRVRLTTRLDPDLPEIDGQPIELQQVILNLLLNAAEASSQVPLVRRDLLLTTSGGAREIEIAIRDGGTGFDAANLQRMFDPFFTTKPDGMGLGLTISAQIVAGHGGRLWAESNVTGGLTLRCALPIHASR